MDRTSTHVAPCPALPSKDWRPGWQVASLEMPEGRAKLLTSLLGELGGALWRQRPPC